jgi:hypothetical protein
MSEGERARAMMLNEACCSAACSNAHTLTLARQSSVETSLPKVSRGQTSRFSWEREEMKDNAAHVRGRLAYVDAERSPTPASASALGHASLLDQPSTAQLVHHAIVEQQARTLSMSSHGGIRRNRR